MYYSPSLEYYQGGEHSGPFAKNRQKGHLCKSALFLTFFQYLGIFGSLADLSNRRRISNFVRAPLSSSSVS